MMPSLRRLSLLLAALPLAAQDDGSQFFEKNVRPLLVQQCLGCHSATSQPIMGGLRLDDRALALKGGTRGPALVPGDPANSLLLKVVRHTAGALKMPPGPKMKDPDVAVLTQWVQMGAPWGATQVSQSPQKKFWAFVPPTAPGVPEVKEKAWAKSPIDAFILAGLEAKGLKPVKPADKRTLIRRATYDLTGLPPSPAEIQAYLQDTSPEAYAKVIDRLLASPRYGERWGRHWLDVARYADSNGLDENLVYKNAFRYRDYVIAAFNKDKPYNQFLTEQLAGDLLPASDDLNTMYERWTATGFLTLGAKMLAEDDPKKMEMDIVDEQLDTTMRAFNGLTVGCARCHDHKFDPIPTADYYSLAGIFKSSKTMENFKVVAKWHEYVLAPKEDRDRLAAHEAAIEAKRKEIGKLVKAENDRLAQAAAQRVGRYLQAAAEVLRDEQVQVAPVETGGISRDAGSYDRGNVSRQLVKKESNTEKGAKGPHFAEYKINVPTAGQYQIDILDEEKGAGTADLWINGVWVKRGREPVQNREASPEAPGWTYLAIVPFVAGENLVRLEHGSRFPYFSKLLISSNTLKTIPLTGVQISTKYGVNPSLLDQVVDYLTRSNGAVASVLYAWEILSTGGNRADWASPVAKLFDGVTGAEAIAAKYEALFQEAALAKDTKDPAMKALHDFLTEKFGPFRAPENARRYYPDALRAQLTTLEAEAKKLEEATPNFPKAMGVTDGVIADTQIHQRGSHWTLGAQVPRRFLRVISGDQQTPIGPQESGRLQLAQWMTSPTHPLTARVMVNRLWRWHFGKGIVPSVDNFGRLGEKPTNQPLLDWLAVEFVRQGWSMKAMHRQIMLSNVYQLSADLDPRSAEADPENTLLWRANRRRLEAEAIRDGIMSVSGGLRLDGGGSILTYKDRQYVANTSKGSAVDYDRPVRATYIPVLRSSMYEVFQAFDLPDPTTSNGDRDSTVVAPQALFMMNSSVMLQHSKRMAEGLLAQTSLDDPARIRDAYERALGRPPTSQEIDHGLTFIARMEKEWQGNRVSAWQSYCKSLLASNEFIYLN
ncbi:MAG: DUF1549 domain-containing protein [Bryobacteraceae bacterium]|nr:DUF1549 domain-containing protein [Bryobacteraceae bacterium]